MTRRFSLVSAMLCIYFMLVYAYIYATRVGVPERGIVILSVFVLLFLAVFLRKVQVGLTEVIWILSAFVMIVWTRRFEPDVVYYDAFFVSIVLILLLLLTSHNSKYYELVIKQLVVSSCLVVAFVMCEWLAPSQMSRVLNIFLKGQALTEELYSVSIKFGYRGLSSSTNAVSLAASVVFFYFLYCWRNRNLLIRLIAMAASAFALVLCGERSNFLFFPVVITVVYLAKNSGRKLNKYSKVLLLYSIVVLAYVLLEPVLVTIPALKRTVMSISHFFAGESVIGERSILNARALEMWFERPIFGYGWFEFYYRNTGILKPGIKSHAHNLILETLSGCGIVGSFFIFSAIICSMCHTVNLLKNRVYVMSDEDSGLLCMSFAFQLFFILDSILHLTFFSQRIFLYLVNVFLTLFIERKLKYAGEKR